MLKTPVFSFFPGPGSGSINRESVLWNKALPLARDHVRQPAPHSNAGDVTLGSYFLALRSFLERNRFKTLVRALSSVSKRPVSADDIDEVDIILVKHGEFYHPSKIEVRACDTVIAFVLNVALTPAGRACLKREYPLLMRLNREVSDSVLPAVYGSGTVSMEDGRKVGMFLGEWFEGYSEFHLSRDPHDGTFGLVVWDRGRRHDFLTRAQAKSVYARATAILTRYYHLTTFGQITCWHHAAGDFVLRLTADGVDLKLVTVRQYTPLFAGQAPDGSRMLDALLVFFLNLSVRMRLDRCDGVGPVVWADDTAVEGVVAGFFQALSEKNPDRAVGESFSAAVRAAFAGIPETDLLALLNDIVARYPSGRAEDSIIRRQLKKHGQVLHRCLIRAE